VPIGRFHEKYGVTLSLPSVVGAGGVQKVLEPSLSGEEEQGLQRSAEAIRNALDGVKDARTAA
jgi:L-lactate dehydrogenase